MGHRECDRSVRCCCGYSGLAFPVSSGASPPHFDKWAVFQSFACPSACKVKSFETLPKHHSNVKLVVMFRARTRSPMSGSRHCAAAHGRIRNSKTQPSHFPMKFLNNERRHAARVTAPSRAGIKPRRRQAQIAGAKQAINGAQTAWLAPAQ
jgi:hypothetical protein